MQIPSLLLSFTCISIISLLLTYNFLPFTSKDSSFDCPATTKPNATLKELRAAMMDFADLFYTKKDLSGAFNKYVAADYIQHHRDMLDGRETAITALDRIFSNPNFSTEVAETTIGEGKEGQTMVIIHLQATIKGAVNLTVVDMYRLQGTCLVEHWDVLEKMDPVALNPHAYF